jgi:hypothetical protein
LRESDTGSSTGAADASLSVGLLDVTAAHSVEIALLSEIVGDLHQVRFRNTETLRDVVDRRQLTIVKPDLNEDAQREVGIKGYALLFPPGHSRPSQYNMHTSYIFSTREAVRQVS